MINDAALAEAPVTLAPVTLMHDCSAMDTSVVERLRATVEVSLGWADQTLGVLIQLDDDLQALDATVRQHISSLSREEMAQQTAQSVQHLRNGVRDVMMSMQNQDVIGQAVERAAAALEKRAAAIGRAAEWTEFSCLPTGEIAEIHRIYLAEDNLHRAAGPDGAKYQEECNAAASNATA